MLVEEEDTHFVYYLFLSFFQWSIGQLRSDSKEANFHRLFSTFCVYASLFVEVTIRVALGRDVQHV